MKKKGQGLSINVIIIAAIALVVLIVLWAIFTGKMGSFTKGVKDTEASVKCTSDIIGGAVKNNEATCTNAGGTVIAGTFSDVTGDKVCCTK